MGEALSDTLGKLTSAHLARGPTPHEGWALAPVGGAAGARGVGAHPPVHCSARDVVPRTGGWRGGSLLTHNLWFLLILCIMFQTCLDGGQAWTSTINRKSFVMDSVGKAVCFRHFTGGDIM